MNRLAHFLRHPARLALLLLAAGALLGSGRALAQNLLPGNFESPVVANFTTVNAGGSVDGWSVSSGSVDVVGSSLWEPARGLQSIDLNGNAAGTLTRGFTAGFFLSYRLTFAYAATPGTEPALKPFLVTISNTVGGPISLPVVPSTAGATASDPKWQYYSYTFTTGFSSSEQITFSSQISGTAGAIIDDVRVELLNSDSYKNVWPYSLDWVNRDNGAVMSGTQASGNLGNCVAGAGDVNGDGYEDFLICHEYQTVGAFQGAGEVYLVFGSAVPQALGSVLAPGQLNGLTGVRFQGYTTFSEVAPAASGIGDFNGDGYADIALAAQFGFENNNSGEVAIIYGRATTTGNEFGPAGIYNLSSIGSGSPPAGRPADTTMFSTSDFEAAGHCLSGAGDVDNDGYDDLLISAPFYSNSKGRVFLVYGSPNGPIVSDLNSLNGSNGGAVIYNGPADNVQAGESVSGVGDVNGDGFDDVLIGVPFQLDSAAGFAALIFGRASRSFDLAQTAANRTIIRNGIANTQMGYDVTSVGDFNGDGFSDFALGSPEYSSQAGSVAVIFGSSAGVGGSGVLETRSGSGLNGTNGFHIQEFGGGELNGTTVGGAGDVNGDGYTDLLWGAPKVPNNGAVYVLQGRSQPTWAGHGTLSPTTLIGESLLESIRGIMTSSYFGGGLDGIGDYNADDRSDIGMGAEGYDGNRGQAAFVLSNVPLAASATYYGYIDDGIDTLPTGRVVPPKPFGTLANGKQTMPFSRVELGFRGGGRNIGGGQYGASRQSVTINRAAVTNPAGPGTYRRAGVNWAISSQDRESFSEATLRFHYRPAEISGLNLAKADVWYTPDSPPTANSAWSPLGATHNATRRSFEVTRAFSGSGSAPRTAFNGTYTIMDVDLVYDLGSQIPAPATVDLASLPPTGPSVTPANAAVWIPSAKRLIAVRTGGVVVEWRKTDTTLMATTVASLQWSSDPARYQDHIAGSPAVALPNFQLALLTQSETNANAQDVQDNKRFSASTTGRSLLHLAATPGSDPFFQLVWTRNWFDAAVKTTDTATVGSEIVPPGALHDATCGGPWIVNPLARYAAAANNALFYDRETRTGPIFPVNTDNDTSVANNLAVAYYQKGARLIAGATGAFAASELCWAWRVVDYTAQWPSASSVVIASQLGAGKLSPPAFTNWSLYFENDAAKPGFNPNDEHALVAANINGDASVMPLRSDLGSTATSEPYLVIPYQDARVSPALTKMLVLRVIAENGTYKFRRTVEAGKPVLPFKPMDILPLMPETTAVEINTANPVAFIDRKHQVWARRAKDVSDSATTATVNVEFFYPNQQGFFFPTFYPAPPVGQGVPFLDRYAQSLGGAAGRPVRVAVATRWPADPPTLFIGDTLVGAKNGLPTISVPTNPNAGPCSVELAYQEAASQTPARRSVSLIDPVKTQVQAMGKLPEGIRSEPEAGELKLKDLPPHLQSRVTYKQLTDTTGQLRLKGLYIQPALGEGYLLPNVLAPSEAQIIKDLKVGDSAWAQAVDALVAKAAADLDFTPADTERGLLALSAGRGTAPGYVTIVFQNSDASLCDPNLPVSMNVIKVACPTFRGAAAVIEPDCVFDERLTMKHTGDFAGNPDEYIFQWRTQPDGGTDDDTTTPTAAPVLDGDSVAGWNTVAEGPGQITYSIGGASPFTLSDNWFIVRYRPVNANNVVCSDNGAWSQWTAPKLAPGWIKRVLAGLNPFEQRFKQLSDPSRTINTTVDMISQAGPRWEGDVPLNCNSVDDFGLIEIYETVYRRGIDLSIGAGINYQPANNALLLMASRISDLYMLLGNEAFADASDPTIGLLGDSSRDYIAAATSMHAFADLAQTPTLLDEELALLRGRDNSALPTVQTRPIYNRLPWNFSGQLGEVAYQLNYDIRDAQGNFDGTIDEVDAKRIYPQGHGDAWGHYLTAVTDYYRLLRNPFFVWVPRAETIEIGGGDVTVDFQEEQRFARAAAAKARTGAEVVNLTYRQRYVENPAGQFQGYKDSDKTRAWGLAEWSSRAGQGAYFDWVTANAVLPEASAAAPPAGRLKIDRATVSDLPDIASAYQRIQSELDGADQGLNPLGLEKNVMPFDISPSDIDAGLTHFEQIYNRAILAVSSAVTTFNNALNNTQKLREQSETLNDFQQETAAQERDYQNRLIEVFGQPYAEDIGPGGTYPTGYKGPDIYHFLYEDPSALLGLTPAAGDLTLQATNYSITFTNDSFSFSADSVAPLKINIDSNGVLQTSSHSVPFNYTPANGLTKPANWTARLAVGEIQLARSELLQEQGNFQVALSSYNNLVAEIEDQAELIESQYQVNSETIRLLRNRNNTVIGLNTAIAAAKTAAAAFNAFSDETKETAKNVSDAFPLSAGLSFDATSPIRSAVKIAGAIVGKIFKVLALSSDAVIASSEAAKEGVEQRTELEIQQLEGSQALRESLTALQTLVRDEETRRYELYVQAEVMNQSSQKFTAAIARGERLLNEFVRFRLETSAAVQTQRYKNMAYRVFRNDALQKYRAQFDLAARYAFLAARAYDYETNFLPGDARQAGESFLTEIVRSRALGRLEDNDGDGVFNPVTGSTVGDPGLADALARMRSNWDLVIKGQLGFNNPQLDRVVLSLRYDHYQLLPNGVGGTTDSQTGDERWREILAGPAIKVANLNNLPAFNRYCIPFSPRQPVEPGLVIPFSTTINAGQNVFGNPLVANQDQFDSTRFATKLRRVAVLFDNLSNAGVASQPPVYLVPLGVDIMRTPSDPSNIATRSWRLLDQILPVPFLATSSSIASPSWIPSINGLQGQLGTMRRYGQFKAYNDDDSILDSEFTANSRLIGRSVWNDQWVLIIPGVSLLSDRSEGIARFIAGPLDSGTGERTGEGVKDIKIVFDAYAYTGN